MELLLHLNQYVLWINLSIVDMYMQQTYCVQFVSEEQSFATDSCWGTTRFSSRMTPANNHNVKHICFGWAIPSKNTESPCRRLLFKEPTVYVMMAAKGPTPSHHSLYQDSLWALDVILIWEDSYTYAKRACIWYETFFTRWVIEQTERRI